MPTATPESGATPADGGTPSGDLQPVSAMESLPAGVTAEKVTNVSALFDVESGAFADSGFEYDMRLYNTTRPDVRFHIANDTEATFLNASVPAMDLSEQYYLGPTEVGVHNTSTGAVAYGKGPTPVRTSAGFAAVIFALFPQGYVGSLEWEAEGVYTTDSGEQRLVLESAGRNETASEGIFAPSLVAEGEQFRSASGRIEVTASGVVRYGNVSATVERGGETYTKGLEFTIGPYGAESIPKPDWLEAVPEPTLSVESSDRLLAYEYAGDRPLPAGSNLTVGSGGFGSAASTNVTLSESVSPGETVYVYRTGSGADVSYAASVGQRPTLPDDATAFSGEVTITVRVGDYDLAVGTQVGA